MRIKDIKGIVKEYCPLFLILFLAAFLRFYRIEELTSFLGEQGRDLLIAKSILVERKLTLLGPPTSISPRVHFGPFYHYFNAFWLWFFRLNPIGPAIGFSVLGVLSCLFIYLAAKNFGFEKGGLFSSFLFAVSPLMVESGRSMFNSYFIVSFSIFSFWAFSNFLKKQNKLFLFLSGVFAGIALQANFLSYGIILSTLVLLRIFRRDWFRNIFWFLAGCLVAVFPYIAFELRHEFFNTKGFLSLLNEGQAVGFSFGSFVLGLGEVIFKVFSFSIGNKNLVLTTGLIVLSIVFSVFSLLRKETDKFLKTILVFLLIGTFSVRFYSKGMLDHYLGSIYPFVFLFFGYFFEKSIHFKFNFLVVSFLVMVGILNLLEIDITRENGYGMPQGWNMKEVKKVAKIIVEDAQGEFNIANTLDGDTRAYSYRYLVEVGGKRPMGVEEYPKAKSLYIIGRGTEREILSYPVWEIYSFLPARVRTVWGIKNQIKVFKLEKI